jgi:transcriptional regulator with XRE-family HTH domain
MATNAVLPGPTSARVSENIERFRVLRGMSQAQLANALTKVGRPMLDTAVSKMERGKRRVDVDDLVALSLALNISPVALLMPPTADLEKVDLTDGFSVSSQTAWLWAAGEAPADDLLLDPVGEHTEEEHGAYWVKRQDYLVGSHPEGRFAAARVLGRTIGSLRAELEKLFTLFDSDAKTTAEVDQQFEKYTAVVRNWLNLLNTEVEEVVAAVARRVAYRRVMPRHPGVPFDEGIPIEEFRNNPVGPYPRTMELRDLGIDDPEQSN